MSNNHIEKLKLILKYTKFKCSHYIKHLSQHCNHLLVEINPSDGDASYAKCCICGSIFHNNYDIIAGLSLNMNGTKSEINERLDSGLQLFVPENRVEEGEKIKKKIYQYRKKINIIKNRINNL